jgi:hypothetical protein
MIGRFTLGMDFDAYECLGALRLLDDPHKLLLPLATIAAVLKRTSRSG